VAVAERARALATHVYLTDETTLLYVLEVGGARGAVMVEDARTGEAYKMRASALTDWRVIRSEDSDA
jgi:hypothetical protein